MPGKPRSRRPTASGAPEPPDDLGSAQDEFDKITEETRRLVAEQAKQAESLTGGALTREGVEDAKRTLDAVRRKLERKQAALEAAETRVQEELERRQQHLREAIRQQTDAIATVLQPVEKMVRQMREGLASMELYLGRGEQIVTIRDGKRADALEPITIRQMVLAMDEETGMFAEDGGMNASDIEEFDQWLLEDEEHVQQIAPETKCVVALVPRWTPRKPEDLFRHEDDMPTHFLVRNGQALFRTTIRYEAGDHLTPGPTEFIEYFKDPQGRPIKPNTDAYAKALERSDARSRHYLRIGLILQGLVDRTEIFHPLHPAGINMLSDPGRHPEKVRIITDGERALESGLPTFREWREETNAQLRPGMRIIGAFDSRAFQEENRQGRGRIYPERAERPPTGVPLVIEDRRPNRDLIVRYQRTQAIWDRDIWRPNPDRPSWGWSGGERPSKTRASCVVRREDPWILAYDLADAETARRFLSDRRDRRNYTEMWPLLRALWYAKSEEERQEEPFRAMLAGVLAREAAVSVDAAQAAVPDLVRWWKLSNRYHRPLRMEDLGDEEHHRTPGGRRRKGAPSPGEVKRARATREAHESKAVRMIIAEYRRRLKDTTRTVNEDLVGRLAAENPGYLVVARLRSGGYLVLAPEEPDRDIYVREIRYTATGQHREEHRNRLVGSRAERWTILRESDRWAGWDRMAFPQDHTTAHERKAFCEQMIEHSRKEGTRVMAVTQAEADGPLYAWVIKHGTIFDPAHPLTVEMMEPAHEARGWRWQRKGTGAATLQAPLPSDTHSYAYGDGGGIPWEGHYSKDLAQTILFRDDSVISEWQEEWRAYDDASRYHQPYVELRDRIDANLRRQWTEHELAREHQKFLATGSPPADWADHKAELEIEWPWDTRRFRMHHDERTAWDQSLAHAIEEGHATHGVSTDQLFAEMVERHKLTGNWVPAGTKGVLKWDSDAPVTLRDSLSGLTIDLTPEPEPAEEPELDEPDPSPEDEDAEEEARRLADAVSERISEALRPPKPEPVVASFNGFDVLDAEPPES